MRIAALILSCVFLSGATFLGQTAPAPGGIHLLTGYVHAVGSGIDSSVGTITKKNGLSIQYDIGEMAGVYTDCPSCGWTSGELWRKTQVMSNRNVVIVYTKAKRLVVSFPNSRANFVATVRSESDVADMLLMVLTYTPQAE